MKRLPTDRVYALVNRLAETTAGRIALVLTAPLYVLVVLLAIAEFATIWLFRGADGLRERGFIP